MSTPTPTPTPRTYAAKIKSGFAAVPDQFYEFARTLETELTALTAERDQLRAALALGQINCDAEYDDLRDERDAARACAERAEAELAIERARLDWLEQSAGDIRRYNSSRYIWFANQNLRDAIDAAMKEDAK